MRPLALNPVAPSIAGMKTFNLFTKFFEKIFEKAKGKLPRFFTGSMEGATSHPLFMVNSGGPDMPRG
jgi:hypothetical protein